MKPPLSLTLLAFLSTTQVTACQHKPASNAVASPHGTSELQRGEIRRTLVESQPATGLPGWETRLYLIEYGPGAVAPVHVHPMVGVGQVLEGSFASAFGDDPIVEVHSGQGFVDPAGVPHRVFRNLSPDRPLRFLVAYTIHPNQQIFYAGSVLPPE